MGQSLQEVLRRRYEKGADMSGEIHFGAGARLKILVGEKGEDARYSGGGGGSYSILQNQNNRAGDNTGNGSVIITFISVDGIPTISSPVSGSKYQTVPLSAYYPTALEYHWQYSLDGSSYTTITRYPFGREADRDMETAIKEVR